jgi:hypothetical protein
VIWGPSGARGARLWFSGIVVVVSTLLVASQWVLFVRGRS